jgi:hypothetical protein
LASRREGVNDPPWWLEGGTEICGVCGQSYSIQMERRCAHCDAPLCSVCESVEEDEIVCFDCNESVAE